jgi:Protein of unknown function (DUF3426)
MPSASSFLPIEDRAFDFALRRREAKSLGADASGRRAHVSSHAAAQAAIRSPRRAASRTAWPLAWIFAGFGAWALLIGARAQIARLAPAAAPLYAALGLKLNLHHMGLDHVASRLDYEDGRQILIVEGEIRNIASSPRVAPRMRLSVFDARGREIYHWIAAPPKAWLAAGETAEFRARLAAPPKEGQKVRVRFAGGPDASTAPW